MGQLCDDGCTAIFTKNNLNIFKNGKLIIKGLCNKRVGLWDVPFNETNVPPSQPTANVMVDLQQSKKDLASFHHGVLGGPVKTTFLHALHSGYFSNWPGLTTELISKHLEPKLYIAKGHISQEKQGLWSTASTDTKIDSDFVPDREPLHTHVYFLTIKELDQLQGKSHSDLTG